MDIKSGQPEENLSTLAATLDHLPGDTDIVCLPELFTTGYLLDEVERLAEEIPAHTSDFIRRLAIKHRVNIIAGSILEREGRNFFNTAIVFDREGEITGTYRKIHLFSLFDEPRFLKAGVVATTLKLDVARIGLMICYDLRFPEIARRLASDGAQILFIPSQFPEPRLDHWRHLLAARAIENQVFVAGVNRVGSDEKARFFGHTMVLDPWGEVVAEAGESEENLVAEIDLARIEEVRTKLPAFYDRRPNIY